jgi:hypothetical protein
VSHSKCDSSFVEVFHMSPFLKNQPSIAASYRFDCVTKSKSLAHAYCGTSLAVTVGWLRSSINIRRADYCIYISAETIFSLYMPLFSVVSRNISKPAPGNLDDRNVVSALPDLRFAGEQCLASVFPQRSFDRPSLTGEHTRQEKGGAIIARCVYREWQR